MAIRETVAMFAGLTLGVSLAPEVSRQSPDSIVVEGASYAYTVPESQIVEGMEVLHGIAWDRDQARIVFEIDPLTAYEVHTFEHGNGQTADHDSVSSTPDREFIIDHIIGQRIVWERQFNQLRDGTHPGIDGPVDFFELSQAIVRVHSSMGDE
ncbi:MAG: hypothetical protein JJ916_04275 [Phycisphaerales bacterium]|nr:hypothetical protein [Phycisphaerales bacterium]